MKRWSPLALVLMAWPLLMGQGCPSAQRPLSGTQLAAKEKSAVDSAREGLTALSEAVGVSQAPADASHNTSVLPGSVTFGTCPAITTAAGQGAIDLTIDFGDSPCVPALFPDLSCEGSATGTLNAGAAEITISFNGIGCNSKSLTGQGDVTFNLAQSDVGLAGTFELMWVSNGTITAVDGAGDFQYDRTAKAATVTSFNGTLTNADSTYTAVCTGLVIDPENNANLVPSAGTMDLSGSIIRALTIRFDANSPSTGDVEVSVDGGDFFTVNLYDL